MTSSGRSKSSRQEEAGKVKGKGDKLDVRVRRLKRGDIPAVVQCQNECYPQVAPEHLNDERKMRMQLEAFPDGQFLAEIDGKVVGYCTSLIVQLDDASPWYSYNEITGMGTFGTHDPSGDTLYGSDIAVHPSVRGMAIAGKLYQRRKNLLKKYNACVAWWLGKDSRLRKTCQRT